MPGFKRFVLALALGAASAERNLRFGHTCTPAESGVRS